MLWKWSGYFLAKGNPVCKIVNRLVTANFHVEWEGQAYFIASGTWKASIMCFKICPSITGILSEVFWYKLTTTDNAFSPKGT